MPTTHIKSLLTERTAASQIPQKWGAPGGLKTQLQIEWAYVIFLLLGWLTTLYNCFEAPRNLLPQSEKIVTTRPRLAINLPNSSRKALVDRPSTTSKWTALTHKQFNTTMYTLCSLDFHSYPSSLRDPHILHQHLKMSLLPMSHRDVSWSDVIGCGFSAAKRTQTTHSLITRRMTTRSDIPHPKLS